MSQGLKIALSYVIVLAVAFPLWACSQETEIEAQVKRDLPQGKIKIGSTKVSGSLDIECGQNDFSDVEYECKVTVKGTVDGTPFNKEVNVKLKTKCAPGKRIRVDCDDPLLVQLPIDATGFASTYDDGGGLIGPMTVETGLTSLSIAPGETLVPEPGQQFVLISFPESVPNGSYEVTLDFGLSYIRPIDAKAAVVARMRCDDETIYPPIVPCGLKDFVTLPAATIPVSDVLVPITVPLDGVPDSCTVDVALCGAPTPAKKSTWGEIKSIFR